MTVTTTTRTLTLTRRALARVLDYLGVADDALLGDPACSIQTAVLPARYSGQTGETAAAVLAGGNTVEILAFGLQLGARLGAAHPETGEDQVADLVANLLTIDDPLTGHQEPVIILRGTRIEGDEQAERDLLDRFSRDT